jgi:beta-glucosidase
VIAATWNVELAYKMGQSVGNEAIIGNERADGRPYSGWYAPAVNIHRTPFSGRNFEYYSEDPFLSGKLAVEVIKGCRSRGVYTQLKHFAVNDQETNRSGVCTWLTEQSLREIYLKPFELAVKEGGTMGIMSSFNRFGSLWTGGDYRLLTEILRNEWGFKGMVITDFNTEPFMDTKQMAYAGGDLNLATTPAPWEPTTAADYIVLRNSVKNIIYTTARSNAMNGCGEGAYYVTYFAWWETTIFVVDIVIAVGITAWGVIAIYFANKKKGVSVAVSEETGEETSEVSKDIE